MPMPAGISKQAVTVRDKALLALLSFLPVIVRIFERREYAIRELAYR